MSATLDITSDEEEPVEHSEDIKEIDFGAIFWREVPISDVEHWTEDGNHIFRSTEFDMLVANEDEQRAVDQFVETTEDLLNITLATLQQGEVAHTDLDVARILIPRFLKVYKVLERLDLETESQARRPISVRINLGRRRGEHSRVWRPRSRNSPANRPSSLSPA